MLRKDMFRGEKNLAGSTTGDRSAGKSKPARFFKNYGSSPVVVVLPPETGFGEERRRREAAMKAREEELTAQAVVAQVKAIPKTREEKPRRERPKPAIETQDGKLCVLVKGVWHPFDMDPKPPYKAMKTIKNTRLAVVGMGYICTHDEFTHQHLIETEKGALKLTDEFCLSLREEIIDVFGFEPRKGDVRDVIEARCWDNRFNSVVGYLDGLAWDGVARIDTWLMRYCGVEDTELHRAIGRKVLCAAVRRAKRPGCEAKYTLVLEGKQDAMKSRMLKALVGGVGERVFTDQGILDKNEQQTQEHLEGRWLVELSELVGIRRAGVEKMKACLSRTTDRGRKAYGHYPQDQARSCIFVGTTNDQEYLMDQTGNSRWWPVATAGMMDVDGIERDRDQLWAEACMAEPGEPLYLDVAIVPEARKAQDARRNKHIWESVIPDDPKACGGIKVGDAYRVHTAYLLETFLDIDLKKLLKGDPSEADRVAKTLTTVMLAKGWAKAPNSIRVSGKVGSGYLFKIPELTYSPGD